MSLSITDRRRAWDAGLDTALQCHLRGTPLRSPFSAGSARHRCWQRGTRAAALMLELRP